MEAVLSVSIVKYLIKGIGHYKLVGALGLRKRYVAIGDIVQLGATIAKSGRKTQHLCRKTQGNRWILAQMLTLADSLPFRDRSYRSQKRREDGRWRIRACVLGKLIVGIMPLIVMLLSCQASNVGLQGSWNTYHNPRYGFEFLYPSNWASFPMPDNGDGGAFRDPKNPSTEIRGWAANKLSETVAFPSSSGGLSKGGYRLNVEALPKLTPQDSPKSQQQNFTTDQGLTGKLQVDVGSDSSLMRLTLSQGKVQYNWQGQCNSKQFADYYRFFYYIASQYRLPPP